MEYLYLETENRFNTYVVYLLTNTQYHYNTNDTHKKRTEVTQLLNTCMYKVRMGKDLRSSYTMVSEHKCRSNNERIK